MVYPAHSFTVDQVLNQTTGGFTKLGTGTAILNQANTYTGTTLVNQGALNVTGSGVLGGASGSTADAGNIVFGQNLNSGALISKPPPTRALPTKSASAIPAASKAMAARWFTSVPPSKP